MAISVERRQDIARVGLGLIRLVNGGLALLAPTLLLRQLRVDPRTEAAAKYPFRLFGIRTVLIAADLLLNRGTRADAVRVAPIIHVSDTISAALAGIRGDLPRRAAITATLISTVNVALSIAAQPRKVQ